MCCRVTLSAWELCLEGGSGPTSMLGDLGLWAAVFPSCVWTGCEPAG